MEDTTKLYWWGVFVCGAGMILNLCLVKKRGRSAQILAAAFLCLGIALYLASTSVSRVAVCGAGAAVAALLIWDLLLRVRRIGERL